MICNHVDTDIANLILYSSRNVDSNCHIIMLQMFTDQILNTYDIFYLEMTQYEW